MMPVHKMKQTGPIVCYDIGTDTEEEEEEEEKEKKEEVVTSEAAAKHVIGRHCTARAEVGTFGIF